MFEYAGRRESRNRWRWAGLLLVGASIWGPAQVAACGALDPGASLAPGQAVSTCNGNGQLIHQSDGNVVFYDQAGALWASGTHGSLTSRLVMQGDGNLVLYGPGDTPLWHSQTHGNPGAWLAVQDDCNLVIYSATQSVLWASYAFCRSAPTPPPPPPLPPPPQGGGTGGQAAGTIIGAMYHNWYTPDRWTQRGPYMPVLGEYDSADPAVINQHIAWAKQAGINTLVIDAWITDGDQGWMDRNTPNILDGLDANEIRYFFIADGWFTFEGTDPGNLSAHDVASRVNTYLSKYFNRPGYLKVNNKPALFFWASDGTPCEFWRLVREGIEGTIGPIYMTGFTNSATDNKCFDRLMYYNPFDNKDGRYEAQIANQERMWNQVFKPSGTPWAPTATPGYNDVHLGRGNPPVPLNADYFRNSMKTALSAKSNDSDRWMFVCSFNEWYEASVIEPNTSFTDPETFLKIMRQELEAAGWLESTSPTISNNPPPPPSPPPPPPPAGHNMQCFPSYNACAAVCGGVCERRINCGSAKAHKCFE